MRPECTSCELWEQLPWGDDTDGYCSYQLSPRCILDPPETRDKIEGNQYLLF